MNDNEEIKFVIKREMKTINRQLDILSFCVGVLAILIFYYK